jgi:hypothetical protein
VLARDGVVVPRMRQAIRRDLAVRRDVAGRRRRD